MRYAYIQPQSECGDNSSVTNFHPQNLKAWIIAVILKLCVSTEISPQVFPAIVQRVPVVKQVTCAASICC